MSNVITLHEGEPDEETLTMNNGLTDVFLGTLVLSGSLLARREEEKRLIVWLAERDQAAVGLGAVGFDLAELPWDSRTFEQDRAFLLRAIDGAKGKLSWEYLDWTSSEERLFPALEQFSRMVAQLRACDIQPEALRQWLSASGEDDPIRRGFPVCPIHHTLLTVFGCLLCHG